MLSRPQCNVTDSIFSRSLVLLTPVFSPPTQCYKNFPGNPITIKMGSWDYYCALCGSTFQGPNFISRKPRTQRFLRRQRRRAERVRERADRESLENDQDEDDDERTSDDEGSSADDNESLESDDEEHSYDPDIISSAEAAWSLDLRCMGFNPESPVLSNAFVSGVGTDEDAGGFEVDYSDDPSVPDDLDSYSTYIRYDDDDGRVFPFHAKCFDLLQQVISFKQGSPVKVELGLGGAWEQIHCLDLDKDLLYELFDQHEMGDNKRLDMPYGEPEPPNEQTWEATPGEEIFIADPATQNNLAVETIRDVWLGVSGYSITSTPPALEDPFVRLPVELLLSITSALDGFSFLNLLHASPRVHRSLGNSASLWMQCLRDDLPWFYELQYFLDGIEFNAHTEDLSHNSLRHLFARAHGTTMPRRGMKGPFMGIANRRRIWDICSQLADLYVDQLPPYDSDDFAMENEEEAQFLNEAVCLEMPVVTTPTQDRFYTVRAFWVHTWSQINQSERIFTLKLFWERDNLMGLGTTMEDGKGSILSLFGVDEQEDGSPKDIGQESGISVTEMRIDSDDWITGFILYWPDTSEGYRKPGTESLVSAITVLCASGRKETFGEVSSRDIKRPIVPSKGMSIVGLVGHVGKTRWSSPGSQHFIRFGLLQVPSSNIKDDGRIDTVNSPEDVLMPTWAQKMAWTNDCTEIFTTGPSGRIGLDHFPMPFTRARSSSGIPIWDLPNLRIQQAEATISSYCHDDLIAYHPLIWAQDVKEARSLRRLTGWVPEGSPISGFTDGKSWHGFERDICGIKAKFAPESGLELRSIGMEEFADQYQDLKWDESQCMHLDIDGAGGEMITGVAVAQQCDPPDAVKLITSRGREVYWGQPNEPENKWRIYTAPEGEMLVGIVSSFSRGSGWDQEADRPLRSAMSSVAILSLPMK